MPPRLNIASNSQPFNLLSLLQNLPVAPSNSKNGICASCSYSFSAKGPMTYKLQHKSKLKPHRDPYREAQAKQRKVANQKKQKELQEQRKQALGDPVRSIPTPFIESLATGQFADAPSKEELRNFFLGPNELEESLAYSKKLSAPYIPPKTDSTETNDDADSTSKQKISSSSGPSGFPRVNSVNKYLPSKPEPPSASELTAIHEGRHENAARALALISSLSNGSSADLTRHNKQRCISTFGRHATDAKLPPRPRSIYNITPSIPKLRAGPDTGSSEVQVAILTTKINVLANNLHKKDKLNKRGLRLMVHKRQKLLSYLRRKERAGPRWKNLVEVLGIQDAMWKGEISL